MAVARCPPLPVVAAAWRHLRSVPDRDSCRRSSRRGCAAMPPRCTPCTRSKISTSACCARRRPANAPAACSACSAPGDPRRCGAYTCGGGVGRGKTLIMNAFFGCAALSVQAAGALPRLHAICPRGARGAGSEARPAQSGGRRAGGGHPYRLLRRVPGQRHHGRHVAGTSAGGALRAGSDPRRHVQHCAEAPLPGRFAAQPVPARDSAAGDPYPGSAPRKRHRLPSSRPGKGGHLPLSPRRPGGWCSGALLSGP